MSTGYVYDARFLEHASRRGQHPERPDRLKAIRETLSRYGALDRMTALTATAVTDEDLLRVHTAAHVAYIKSVAESGGGLLDPDTYAAAVSYDVARLAAGGTVAAVDAVLDGEVDNAFALPRPPGHHASAQQAEGFCLFNNVAVAAAHARSRGVERVAIVDFDVHHGNGTQDIFYSDPDVLYISTHQSPLYPGTGHWRETGAGAGRGATINIPLPPGTGDQGMDLSWHSVIYPALARFSPELLLVSAGFDAHWRDPLAMQQVSIAGFADFARQIVQFAKETCGGRIVVVLEGGYDLDALGFGSLAVARALFGEPTLTDPLGPSSWPEDDVTFLLDMIRRFHNLK